MREEEQSQGVLGRDVHGPVEADQLQTVPWSHPGSDTTVEFATDELTALCPVTGQPDFYELSLSYRPSERLIESKALKLYLWSFRDKGAFAEDMAATILNDLVAACEPEQMTVDLTQKIRGGLKLRTVVRHGEERE